MYCKPVPTVLVKGYNVFENISLPYNGKHLLNVSRRTSFSTCAECYSHSYNTFCSRPDCGLHGYSAKSGSGSHLKTQDTQCMI